MGKLEIKNLIVETDGKIVVNDVSFVVESGEAHVLMGANGSGKTSLVNALAGHPKYKITQGEILLDGKDMTKSSVDERAKAGMFLSMQILPEIEGVTFVKFLHTAYKSLKGGEISVLDFYKYLEQKADSIGVNKDFLKRELNVGFSGGEKKQSEILQLLALEPKFAFLDEIDSGVDIDAINRVFTGIEQLRKEGTAFLLVTHNLNILDKITPDMVYVMKDGKIIKKGKEELVEEIKKKGFN
ncbi:Fe-S cluster assembly ATPase SufC [Patescibacteria group bacterium]